MELQIRFLQQLADLRTPAGDTIFQAITLLAQEVLVVAVICWLFWCSNKRLAYALGFGYFTSGLLVQGLKITFRVPRPWVIDPDFSPVESALEGATGYSFPSGHTQSAAALFGTLGLHVKRLYGRILSFVLVLLIGFSRMYLGCHTPMDVCTSLVVTLVLSAVTYHLFYRKVFYQGREGITAVVMALVCVGLSAYALILNRQGIIDVSYAQDCLKAAGAGMGFSLGFYVEQKYIRFSPPANASEKIIRLISGLVVTVGIQEGLKPMIGTSLPASFIRYFLVVVWILILYPLIFTRFSKGQKKLSQA